MKQRRHKTEQGFTLIELMIVVAIIGILAAIAIPNFITYQLKSKTIEAKTNLAGIKTAELTFAADRSCYLSVQNNGWPGSVPSNGAQVPWPTAAEQTTPGALCINPASGAPASAIGTFGDIGFSPSGQVRYNYHVAASASRTSAPGPVTNGCPGWPSPIGAGPTNGPTRGFLGQAVSDLDGNGKFGAFMVSESSHVVDCAPNVY